jgi:hypothetical protein
MLARRCSSVSLSDGEDSIRSLQRHLSPRAQHLLDWFHLPMRLQRLRQFLVGLTQLDTAVGAQMQTALDWTKWSLWHGKPEQPTTGSARWNGGCGNSLRATQSSVLWLARSTTYSATSLKTHASSLTMAPDSVLVR